MGKLQRIESLFIGLMMIFSALILSLDPEDGYGIIIFILTVILIVTGLKDIIFYLSMAKLMVGGKSMLYKGIILFDLGILTDSFQDVPQIYVLLYLFVVYVFSGTVDILKSLEAKKLGASSWKFRLFRGIFNIAIAVLCVLNTGSVNTAVYIYCIGLFNSGLLHVISAFRRSAIVYIQ